MGMGAAMMPIMSGAMKTLRRAAIAKASTTLNIIQQVGAWIGTAVLSVILVNELSDRLPQGGGDGLGAANVPDRVREQIAPLMADAFGATFWWAVGLLVLAFLAAFLLPFHRTEALDEAADGEEAEAAPVVVPV
jgi:hypothetical protein